MQDFRLIAILGGSGSGKSALGLELAYKLDCEIFSLDSLAIYQEFDIVSAKPSKSELETVHHYGINVLTPMMKNNAMTFRNLLLEAINHTKKKGKDTLLIIGGSSFYLKSIIEGLSPAPSLDEKQRAQITQQIHSLKDAYAFLKEIDPIYPIHQHDTYRLHKTLEIYFATHLPPSIFFATHPKEKFPYKIEKYAIEIDREILRDRIAQRTQKMLQNGLIDEISEIFKKYDYSIQPSSAIGVRETIEFITQIPLHNLQNPSRDSHPAPSLTPPSPTIIARCEKELCNLISTHTAQLAKRQSTFNRTQFGEIYSASMANARDCAKEGIVFANCNEIERLICL